MDKADLTNVANGVKVYEWCNCTENYLLNNNECGCGRHHLHEVGSDNIHWLGQHWEIECAFKHAITGLSQAFCIFKYMDDEDII